MLNQNTTGIRLIRTITSCRTDRVPSFILSNSSIQQIPLSLNTKAPLQTKKKIQVEKKAQKDEYEQTTKIETGEHPD